MNKIMLFIPPAYETSAPPLGTPALAGYLKTKGIPARQRDLNILYFAYIGKRQERLFSSAYRDEKIAGKVYYHDILRYERSKGIVDYWFEHNPGSGFSFTEKILSSRHLFRYLADEEENPFVRFGLDKVLPLIRKGSYPIVGFSITAPSQVVASLTFCGLLKREWPRIKIVIGGQWVSLYREELIKRRDFLRLFDYMIYFEGETPLHSLLTALRGDQSLEHIPNLIYRQGRRWQVNAGRSEEALDSLPPPDFDGLPLKKYARCAKQITLTFETSRGCYWNRCIFCVDLPLPKSTYREKSADLVVRDIKVLIEKYGVEHLIISNAVFSPGQMQTVAEKIIAAGIDITWWAFARYDRRLTREILELAKKSGCRMLGFGLESINQRVLNFVKKGTETATIKRILRDLHELEIPFFIQTMLGLPSERVEEALDTINFLTKLPGAGTVQAAFNIYYLTPKNEVFLHPEKYGLAVMADEKLPFRFFYPFRHLTGNIHEPLANKLIGLFDEFTYKATKP